MKHKYENRSDDLNAPPCVPWVAEQIRDAVNQYVKAGGKNKSSKHPANLSDLDFLAKEQGISEPTDLNAIWGCLEGAIDDEFLQAIQQQRTQQ